MASEAGRAATMRAIEAGILAVEAAAAESDPEHPTACPAWTVHDLVRHLEAIAGAYVLWVGAAIGGRIGTMRTPDALVAYNDRMLQRLPELPTAQHLERFRALAGDHVQLVRTGWEQPMMRTPGDTVLSVGDHGGVAALEWHLHAWDLGGASGGAHRPSDHVVEVLCATWDDTLVDITDTMRDTSREPWPSLLAATGRVPT